jgi:hypothetical protein
MRTFGTAEDARCPGRPWAPARACCHEPNQIDKDAPCRGSRDRRNLLDAATMRGRRYYVKSNMTRQIGEGEIDMLGELGNRRQRPQEL